MGNNLYFPNNPPHNILNVVYIMSIVVVIELMFVVYLIVQDPFYM